MRPYGVSIKDLMNRLPQQGEVVYISVRPQRMQAPQPLESVFADIAHGLENDHYGGGPGGKRQVTLISAEHITAVASMLGKDAIDPAILRRNIVIKGINLLALKDQQFRLGGAVLQMTGQCHPCSRMEENLGEGGYNAMRGHGGITARIIKSGTIRLGDKLCVLQEQGPTNF